MLKLLVVEDERDVAANIAEFLEPRGYLLDFAYDGATALNLLASQRFDVVVLDLGLPRVDGIRVSQQLREQDNTTPILVLTARDAIEDKTLAFNSGADDYLVKPFVFAELELRLQALHRRQLAQGRLKVLRIADLTYDAGTLTAMRAEQRLELSRSQRILLELLMRATPNVVTKTAIVERLWGDTIPGPDALRTLVYELRQVVDKPFAQLLIHTKHGEGYAMYSTNN